MVPKPFPAENHGLVLLKIITTMKLLFILFGAGCTMLAPAAAAQQQPDTVKVLVHYKFSYIRDTTNRAKPYTESTVLLIGRRAGVYKSYEEHRSASEYYQFPNEKKQVRKETVLFSEFQLTDVLPAINWQVTRDTASFGGLHCQKATGHFRGRNYTAWFCPDLPCPLGPLRLNGLPGVILEAYDDRKEVCFSFESIEKATVLSTIKVPANLVPTTEKEFTKLQETFRKDPDAFLRMVAAQGDGSGRQMHIDMKPGPQPVINNPIELPEKK